MGSFARYLRCTHCGAQFGLDPLWEGCPACRRDDFVYALEVEYDEAAQLGSASKALPDGPGGVWRFDPLLPVSGGRKITLEEDRTPQPARSPCFQTFEAGRDPLRSTRICVGLSLGQRQLGLSTCGGVHVQGAALEQQLGGEFEDAQLTRRNPAQNSDDVRLSTGTRKIPPFVPMRRKKVKRVSSSRRSSRVSAFASSGK